MEEKESQNILNEDCLVYMKEIILVFWRNGEEKRKVEFANRLERGKDGREIRW